MLNSVNMTVKITPAKRNVLLYFYSMLANLIFGKKCFGENHNFSGQYWINKTCVLGGAR